MNDKKEIKKISTSVLGRGLSLLNLTVSSGAKYASYKMTDLFSQEKGKDERLQKFWLNQASSLVDELGKLKGSIMKAGQLLSVYGEHLFPSQVNDVLKSLQSNSRPVVWEEMERVIKLQLGPETFASLEIDPVPVAAASMGQVYKARILKSKQWIALKVQYPGVDKVIESDLKSLKSILSISHIMPSHEGFDDVFKEIKMMLRHETDYGRELTMIEQYRS